MMTKMQMIAATVLAAGFLTGMQTANAACQDYVTHWGRISPTPDYARSMAFAGMDWKIRTRLGDTVRLVRGIRIEQCKPRGGYGWQCQASIVIDRCM